jgi:hypothetical protein
MSGDELGEALIASRGSYAPEAARLPQAVGLARAAIEAELSRGGDARVAIRRSRHSDLILVGREPDDPSAVTTAADLLDHAALLGQRAAAISKADPLLPRQRAIEELRAVPTPDDAEPLSDQRLVQLSAEASNGVAALSGQGLLYPGGMPAERALRLAASTLTGQELTIEAVRARVSARFPRAEPLPMRPALDHLLETCGVPLRWDAAKQKYAAPTWQTLISSTRMATTISPLAGPADVAAVDAKLVATIEGSGFLTLLSSVRTLARARASLHSRYTLSEVNITAIMLDVLRSQDLPWEAIIEADNGNTNDADFRSLTNLVQHSVMPEIRAALTAVEPILMIEAAPLARYGQLGLLRELNDPTRPRPAARFLLVPARRPEPAMLDDEQIPLTSAGSQSLWLPDAWIEPTTEGSTV